MTTSPSNIILKYPASGTVTRRVTIATQFFEQNWTKNLPLITIPKSTDSQDVDVGASTTKAIDLLMKAEKRWTITGMLGTGIGTTAPEENNATDKRDDLREIMFGGGSFLATIEGTDYQVNSDKISVKWKANDEDPVSHYDVIITLIESEDLV